MVCGTTCAGGEAQKLWNINGAAIVKRISRTAPQRVKSPRIRARAQPSSTTIEPAARNCPNPSAPPGNRAAVAENASIFPIPLYTNRGATDRRAISNAHDCIVSVTTPSFIAAISTSPFSRICAAVPAHGSIKSVHRRGSLADRGVRRLQSQRSDRQGCDGRGNADGPKNDIRAARDLLQQPNSERTEDRADAAHAQHHADAAGA